MHIADKSVGSTPAGSTDQESAARAVQRMFDEIAPRYDFLNHTLSLNVDRLWWRRAARTFLHILSRKMPQFSISVPAPAICPLRCE
jgi:demethylmenaquinone methyltransferase/2-methoxy-6-polyprenyl-1,4-benzoquinol methylase